MDIEKSKLFVGGIPRETSEEDLRAYFGKYGTVSGALVAKEKATQNPRGFGFVWFSDTSSADKALNDSHVILGRTVEVKKAIPKSEQLQNHKNHPLVAIQQKNTENSNNNSNTKKIFVGGLSSNLTEEQFKNYFSRFGEVIDVVVMQDSSTNRPRGFGFITFESEESVDKVMLNNFHDLNGRMVEVKKAVPKEELISADNSITTPPTRRFHPENFFPFGSGYQICPNYPPFPWYNGNGWYPYGGYPNNGVGVIPHRGPYSPAMIGPMMCPSPYYPTYVSSYVMMPNGLAKNCGVTGCVQCGGALSPIGGVKSEFD